MDPLALGGRKILADVVCANRQLTVTAINQDRETNCSRPAMVGECVECRANGSARVKNIIDEDDGLAIDPTRRNVCW